MRLLHLSDLHGRRSWYRWLVQVAPGYDLVCLAGDLIDQERDIPFVRRALLCVRVPLAVCSGNHDVGLDWLKGDGREGLWLDGERFVFGSLIFRCVAWDAPLLPADPHEIWLTHVPPRGTTPARTRHRLDYGDEEFGNICAAGMGPAIALCGHVHEMLDWHATVGRTLVLNPGCATESPRPNFVVLRFAHGVVRYLHFGRTNGLAQ